MKRIESFNVNHLNLNRGIYVSRRDFLDEFPLTTFDIRMKKPNKEAVMSTTIMHTIEHLGATFLRNHPLFADKTVYFGPMGCRTGFYVIFKGRLDSANVVDIIKEMFLFIMNFSGDIPGASPVECGNYTDLELPSAQKEAEIFYNEVLKNIKPENLVYPN